MTQPTDTTGPTTPTEDTNNIMGWAIKGGATLGIYTVLKSVLGMFGIGSSSVNAETGERSGGGLFSIVGIATAVGAFFAAGPVIDFVKGFFTDKTGYGDRLKELRGQHNLDKNNIGADQNVDQDTYNAAANSLINKLERDANGKISFASVESILSDEITVRAIADARHDAAVIIAKDQDISNADLLSKLVPSDSPVSEATAAQSPAN